MPGNYSDHAANERTFLAWVRTVIAIVGFGLAAARLGDGGPGIWSEVAMLGSGAVVILLAFARMRQVRGRIRSGRPFDDDSVAVDALLMVLVAALFALIAVFGVHISG